MKIKFAITTAVVLAALSPAAAADYYTQDFNGMGPAGVTAPSGWYMYYIAGSGSSSLPPTGAEMATASLGIPALKIWNATDTPDAWSQEAANMGATSISTDRLLGTSPTATRGSILHLELNNSSGAPIDTIGLSYTMQIMTGAAQTELPGYSFYYLDGSTWTPFTGLDQASSGTASAMFYYTTPVPIGGTMQFRWFDDNDAGSGPDTMLAINNVIVNIPEPGTLSLLALGALALVFRRRKA